ncbi:hypothetical protein MB46_06680 [Arthrobacter alpinus]|uniref:hypothetical protein n=1 Tax=Arthrobacter alpinus TaxID=656366 RepID=UPI0005C98373|nr:hypothetical protein [Arthrobacter alpinus]ALV45234.1 hypothetical protein MB46_06680 [Arthrobacter alpinus]
MDLESGHARAEVGKTMAVLTALGPSLSIAPPIRRGSEHDLERLDYASASPKKFAGYSSNAVQSPKTPWFAALAETTNYAGRSFGQATRHGPDASGHGTRH